MRLILWLRAARLLRLGTRDLERSGRLYRQGDAAMARAGDRLALAGILADQLERAS